MSLFSQPLHTITKEDLESLLTEGVRESQTLDYKQSISLETNEAKTEFLRDLTAFANTSGGDYIIGIAEANGVPTAIPGFAPQPNIDRFELQIQELARRWSKPPLPPLSFHEVKGFPNGSVLIIRVQRSYNAPHLPSVNDETPFEARRSNGKSKMTVGELREVFLRSDAIAAQMSAFLQRRLDRIQLRSLTYNAAAAVVHVMPLASFSGDFSIEIDKINPYQLRSGQFFDVPSSRHNYLGLKGYCPNVTGHPLSEAQVFRSGIIEGISYTVIGHPGAHHGEFNDSRLVVNGLIDEEFVRATKTYLTILAEQEVPPPVFVAWSIKGAEGATYGGGPPIDAPEILIPFSELNTLQFSDNQNFVEAMRGSLDVLYQAMGLPKWNRTRWTTEF